MLGATPSASTFSTSPIAASRPGSPICSAGRCRFSLLTWPHRWVHRDRQAALLKRLMRDYWLNKLFFDIQRPEVAAAFKKDRDAVLARYPMSTELRRAVIEDDIGKFVPYTNAYLLRFYYAILGVKDAELVKRLNELPGNSNSRNRHRPMAKLVGVFAASHGPMIAREWDTLSPPTRAEVTKGFERTGQRLIATKPDLLVIVSPDHLCNFFLNNFPAFCVGIGAEQRAARAFPEDSLQPPGAGRARSLRASPDGHRARSRLRSFILPPTDAGSRLLPAVMADVHRSDPADRADRRQRDGRSDADHATLPRLGFDNKAGD
jgi:hypothetical protein